MILKKYRSPRPQMGIDVTNCLCGFPVNFPVQDASNGGYVKNRVEMPVFPTAVCAGFKRPRTRIRHE